MNFCRALILMIILTGVVFSEGYAPSIVPDRHLDALLLQLSVKYGKMLPSRYFQQPYSYRDIALFLTTASDTAIVLSPQERYLVSKALQRYGVDAALYRYHGKSDNGKLKVNINLLGDVQPGYNDSATMQLRGIINPSFAGNIGKLSFYSGVNVWTEYRSDTLFPFPTYQPYDGVAYNLYGRAESGNVRSSDLPQGGISYDAGRVRLDAAIDYLRCGPSRYFPLTLSGEAPPITFARASCDLEVVQYTHIVGLLKGQKDKRKYLFMHRLEGDAWHNKLHVGINEVVIYGNTTDEPHDLLDSVNSVYMREDRAIEPEYLIPFLPFKFIEHFDGDRDNAALSVDVALFWPRQWSFYGEFFLDDMLSPWKIFTNDWGNKWAMTLGGSYFGALKGKPWSVTAEVSRVEPWVYTHFGGGSHRYTHFNKSLGALAGPNSLSGKVASFLQLTSINEIGFGFDLFARNVTTRGGQITNIFQHPDPLDSLRYFDTTIKKFLGDGSTWSLRPTLYWNFDVYGRFSVTSSTSIELFDNRGRVYSSFFGGLYF